MACPGLTHTHTHIHFHSLTAGFISVLKYWYSQSHKEWSKWVTIGKLTNLQVVFFNNFLLDIFKNTYHQSAQSDLRVRRLSEGWCCAKLEGEASLSMEGSTGWALVAWFRCFCVFAWLNLSSSCKKSPNVERKLSENGHKLLNLT